MNESPQHEMDAVEAARRELHELAVLSTALLRLATKVHSRCETLRSTLGDVEPLRSEEVDRHAPAVEGGGGTRGAGSGDDDPVALLAMSLAVDGQSRAQIAAYLRTTFGLTDTDELLDRVLRTVRPPA